MSILTIASIAVAISFFVVSYFVKSAGYSLLFATIAFVFLCVAMGPVGQVILGFFIAGIAVFLIRGVL